MHRPLIVPKNRGILGNLGPLHESCTLSIRILANLGPVQVLFPFVILKSKFALQNLCGLKRRHFRILIADNVPNSFLAENDMWHRVSAYLKPDLRNEIRSNLSPVDGQNPRPFGMNENILNCPKRTVFQSISCLKNRFHSQSYFGGMCKSKLWQKPKMGW